MHLPMTAHVLETAIAEKFETCRYSLCGGHILATVAHNLKPIGLYWSLVANCCVSCSMENRDKTKECLEIAVLKEGNHTHLEDGINCHDFQIDCLCQWRFVNHHLRILNCHHGDIASQIGHRVEPSSLTLVEIPLSSCSVNPDCGRLL